MSRKVHVPNLFVPGVPRGATTAWYEYFKQHPEVFVPDVKGPDYFEGSLYPMKRNYSYREYLKLYKDAEKEQYPADFSHLLDSKIAPEQIYNFNPYSKIIIILRDPVEAICSRWFMYNLNKSRRVPFEEYLETASGMWMLESVRYYSNVKRYMNIFGENVHILIFDDFKKDARQEYEKVCAFLDIDSSIVPPFERINVRKKQKNQWLVWIGNHTPGSVKEVLKKVRLDDLYFKLISASAASSESEIPQEAEKRLRAELKEEIEKVSELIGRDLTSWVKRELPVK